MKCNGLVSGIVVILVLVFVIMPKGNTEQEEFLTDVVRKGVDVNNSDAMREALVNFQLNGN